MNRVPIIGLASTSCCQHRGDHRDQHDRDAEQEQRVPGEALRLDAGQGTAAAGQPLGGRSLGASRRSRRS